MPLTPCCIFIPDRLALLQSDLYSLCLAPELQIRVVIQEAHLLHLTACVFFTRCWIWVVEWDHCAPQLPLLPSMVNIHVIDIESVICEALMCRGSVKDKDCGAIWMCVVEHLNCMPELLNQLGEIPPIVMALSVKAPSCLKVRLARLVLRRVLIEKSLGDTKDS